MVLSGVDRDMLAVLIEQVQDEAQADYLGRVPNIVITFIGRVILVCRESPYLGIGLCEQL
ncbi:MAG: hypothetical protein UZ17_ACD001000247 [Acidobacteria bacterium OLB17]|nr:MAG: hypothetical protein UZ17_ACD001000247 [Acidobacteria bacterium OLB17]